MGQKVLRSELLDYVTWSERKSSVYAQVRAAKAVRRIHVGETLTFLFENAQTVRYQIQEMMRVEKIVKEADIEHELTTYNELIGGPGEMGCVLLIEIPDPDRRDVLLKKWLRLPYHLYVKFEDGTRVGASFDERQIGETRLSSVQYLKFDTSGRMPVAIGCDLEEYCHENTLTAEQAVALQADLVDPANA